jgi:tetratricopeptide (TPR) repeat protein
MFKMFQPSWQKQRDEGISALSLGDYGRAADLLEQAWMNKIEIMRKENRMGPGDPRVYALKDLELGVITCNLALVYHMQDRFEDSEQRYRIAISHMEATLDPQNKALAGPYRCYASLLDALGRTSEAEALRQKAQKISPVEQ